MKYQILRSHRYYFAETLTKATQTSNRLLILTTSVFTGLKMNINGKYLELEHSLMTSHS